MSYFTQLISELCQAEHLPPPAPRPAPAPPVRATKSLSTRPSADLRKALSEIEEFSAETALNGLQIGMGVRHQDHPGLWRVADLDAARGRVKVVEHRDTSDDPPGVSFDNKAAWVDAASLVRAPEADKAGAAAAPFAKALALTNGLRASEAQTADTRRRARELVTSRRGDLSVALTEGRITGIQAAEAEALLNQFSSRMGL